MSMAAPRSCPELKPPPIRASAGAAMTTSVEATANTAINARKPERNVVLPDQAITRSRAIFSLRIKSYAILGCDGA
jgi:hypothetical protein